MSRQRRHQQNENAQCPSETGCQRRHLRRTALPNVCVQVTQRLEDRFVVCIVCAKLHAVGLRDRQSELQNVDGIEAKAVTEEWRQRVDVVDVHLEIESIDHEPCQLGFLGCLDC